MPITIEIIDTDANELFDEIFAYFDAIDERFSTYKPTSEISKVNAGLPAQEWSADMKMVIELCKQTKEQTNGYFDISHNGLLDPSGLVKGWAINNAADMLIAKNVANYYIEAGGDIQMHGSNNAGELWQIGIRNPFNTEEIIKVLQTTDHGVATSGTYIRGNHIYNPRNGKDADEIKSLTVVGPNIYEADRFATAAFAMGKEGIAFIEATKGLEGYSVGGDKIATVTTGFNAYVV